MFQCAVFPEGVVFLLVPEAILVLQPSGIAVAACFSLIVDHLLCHFAHIALDPVCRVVLFTITWLPSLAHQTVCSAASSTPERFVFCILPHGLASPLLRDYSHVCTLLKSVAYLFQICRQPSCCWVQDQGGRGLAILGLVLRSRALGLGTLGRLIGVFGPGPSGPI